MSDTRFKAQPALMVWGKWAARALLPLVTLVVCGWILSRELSVDLIASLPQRLSDIAAWQWVSAAVLTALSLYSVGRYDVLAHRFLRTGLPERSARWTGSIAIALAQSLGFGLFTGALARWRMMPALGAVGAFKLSTVVSVSFVLACVIAAWIAGMLRLRSNYERRPRYLSHRCPDG